MNHEFYEDGFGKFAAPIFLVKTYFHWEKKRLRRIFYELKEFLTKKSMPNLLVVGCLDRSPAEFYKKF
jgi:hypothetical protein